eukprot:TRINITY_DN13581_c0_g2_i1.p1 TRINITY_DN13581_c0_g2~~TRINITY_DN13581_c0_g2_i1.p1  ORF type:complete len:109 (+),score=5.50 TRINITY_DN13581_c0_g2_i1:45-371(+)
MRHLLSASIVQVLIISFHGTTCSRSQTKEARKGVAESCFFPCAAPTVTIPIRPTMGYFSTSGIGSWAKASRRNITFDVSHVTKHVSAYGASGVTDVYPTQGGAAAGDL